MHRLFLLIPSMLISLVGVAQQKNPGNNLSVIPLPVSIKPESGVYTLAQKINIHAQSKDELQVAGFLKAWLELYNREVIIQKNENADIILSSGDATIKHAEGYKLNVNAKKVSIQASAGAGLFYGFQTLTQLLLVDKKSSEIPLVTIIDEPAFKWRGSMLDVSRHFFPVSFIKKYIDFLAAYKINTFHWHLTDDQGWRIEIKKYPKLTEISAFRKETLIGEEQLIKKAGGNYVYDGIPYGGFYTQEQIKEIVAYAAERYITIVPEIEMPGHTVAVLAAYPELACKPGPYDVLTKWGVSEDLICPSETSFQFIENVLAEVVQLFPGKYVHIGGDEAPKKVWKESDLVSKIMKDNNIQDVEKVQGWFNARIEKFLQSKGKKLIGWDEILEGGITPASTVMSWRGIVGGIEAARHGNDVVMSPHDYVYFDYGQNPQPYSPHEPIMICCHLPIEKVYSFNPLPKELTPDLHKYILGVQANLWTEYITSPSKAEYALFPRLLALSEISWTAHDKKEFEGFMTRVSEHYLRLDDKQINYRVPEPVGLTEDKIKREGEKVTITLRTSVPGSRIFYTLDGHMPDETTELYSAPIQLPAGRNIQVRAITITSSNRKSAPVELIVK